MQREDHVRIDGSTGADRVEVIFPDLDRSLGTLVDAYFKADPTLCGGYTHRFVHTNFNLPNLV